MARILYVMKYPIKDNYTVKSKFDGQLKSLVDMGHEVYYLAYDYNHWYIIKQNDGLRRIVSNIHITNAGRYIHLGAYWDLFKFTKKVVREMDFDLVYMRFCPFSASAVSMIKSIYRKEIPCVIEVPTFPPEAEKPQSFLRKLYFLQSQWCQKRIEKYIDLYAIIGYYADNYHGVPAINIENGIYVDLFPMHESHPLKTPYHFISVAAMCNWHGFDRMIKGIANLQTEKQKQVIFDLVGTDGDGSLEKWKKMVCDYHLENQVIFHGYKTGADLDQIFNNADCGVSSLGLYRNGFSSGAVLKVREFAARGLPFIYAHDDPAIHQGLHFCMRVPNDDSDIDVEAVIKFISNLKQSDVTALTIRQYAKANMTWNQQFKKVFDAINLQ